LTDAIAAEIQPKARILDVTRLTRRAGRVPTGVDRVELAYLRALLDDPVPLFGLARTRLGYVLLDHTGMAAFLARIEGRAAWGRADRLSRVMRQLSTIQKQAESDLRRLALARCLPQRLGRMLRQHLPDGVSYLNVGHSNLTDRVLSTIKHVLGARIAVMIHDTIPLDYPQFQRPETLPAFRAMLKRVQVLADLVICNSGQTRRDVTRHMAARGAVPTCMIAPLGADLSAPETPDMPAGFLWDRPYFVTVGTIEPRKNHALLLDIWEEMSQSPDCPQLVICGARGWENEAVFRWLDSHPMVGRLVFECAGFSDGQIAGLLQTASGMLFPSITEGYGLPPIEAAALGVPVICADLPVYHEILGDIPVYAGIEDRYLWINKVRGFMPPNNANRQVAFTPPGWQQHFNTVLRRV
jgi:glycosyltransferase involved in cell wall biosynthesis